MKSLSFFFSTLDHHDSVNLCKILLKLGERKMFALIKAMIFLSFLRLNKSSYLLVSDSLKFSRERKKWENSGKLRILLEYPSCNKLWISRVGREFPRVSLLLVYGSWRRSLFYFTRSLRRNEHWTKPSAFVTLMILPQRKRSHEHFSSPPMIDSVIKIKINDVSGWAEHRRLTLNLSSEMFCF